MSPCRLCCKPASVLLLQLDPVSKGLKSRIPAPFSQQSRIPKTCLLYPEYRLLPNTASRAKILANLASPVAACPYPEEIFRFPESRTIFRSNPGPRSRKVRYIETFTPPPPQIITYENCTPSLGNNNFLKFLPTPPPLLLDQVSSSILRH